jgi:hypothetical protein
MTETYHGSYEGGFQGMKASGEATLQLSGDQFVLRRPRVFFSRSLYKVWAKWTAVTGLSVQAAEKGGSRLELTTKARGTGVVVLEKVEPAEIWEVLDGISDLKDRFHTSSAGGTEAARLAAGTDPSEGSAGTADGSAGETVPHAEDISEDSGDAEPPVADDAAAAAERRSAFGEDISADAGSEVESAEKGETPGPPGPG